MSAPQIPLIFCGTPGLSAEFDRLLANAQTVFPSRLKHIPDLKSLAEEVRGIEIGVFVFLFAGKDDILPILNAFIFFQRQIQQGLVRITVFCATKHPKFEQLLVKKRCPEVFGKDLGQRALLHKLQKHIQIVQSKRKAAAQNAQLPGATKDSGRRSSRPEARKAKIEFIQARDNANDIWLVKNRSDFKYLRGSWLAEMIGPSTAAGLWREITPGLAGRDAVYQWVPREGGPRLFDPEAGTWFFRGKCPKFSWKNNRWQFFGQAPSLYFVSLDAKGERWDRLRARGALELEVALNSASAKSKMAAIAQTFAEKKLFKADAGPELGRQGADLDAVGGGKSASSAGARPDEDIGSLEDIPPGRAEIDEDLATPFDPGGGFESALEPESGPGQGLSGRKRRRRRDESASSKSRRPAREAQDGLGLEDEPDPEGDLDFEVEPDPGDAFDLEEGSGTEDDFGLEDQPDPQERRPARREASSADSEDGFEEEADGEAGLGERTRWREGKDAFEALRIQASVWRLDRDPPERIKGVEVCECEGLQLVLDAPERDFAVQERLGVELVVARGEASSAYRFAGRTLESEAVKDGRSFASGWSSACRPSFRRSKGRSRTGKTSF